MTDFKRLLTQVRSLVVFRKLREDNVIESMMQTMLCIEEKNTDMAVEWYCDMCAELYNYGDDLTEYIKKIMLED